MRNIVVNAAAGFGLVAVVAGTLGAYRKSLKPIPHKAPSIVGPSEKAAAPYLTVVVPN